MTSRAEPVPLPLFDDLAAEPAEDALPAQLRDPGPVNTAVAGGLGWLARLFTPTVPPACRRCGAVHVYRTPARLVLACPRCYPGEVAA